MINQIALCFVEEEPTRQIQTIFSFHRDRPFAVSLRLSTPDHPPVEWIFARDLFIEGLTSPAGLGDVRIAPGRTTIGITLTSPSGTLRLAVSRKELALFCTRMIAEVPLGAESRFFDMDREIRRFADSLLTREARTDQRKRRTPRPPVFFSAQSGSSRIPDGPGVVDKLSADQRRGRSLADDADRFHRRDRVLRRQGGRLPASSSVTVSPGARTSDSTKRQAARAKMSASGTYHSTSRIKPFEHEQPG